MSKIRGKGNRSTEGKVQKELDRGGIGGWVKHPRGIPGCPDFYFPNLRLAMFVHGCFWHACPKCKRRLPNKHRGFWSEKLDRNRRRDQRIRRKLWREGYHVMRVWEHDLSGETWLKRLRAMIRRLYAPRTRPA
jgi:DNA mismatch endonuclease (patch repair protein)